MKEGPNINYLDVWQGVSMSEEKQLFEQLVRIGGSDISGDLATPYALAKVKGIGIRLAKLITKKAGIPLNLRLGYLSREEIDKLKNYVEDPLQLDIPLYYVNRQKDVETGEYKHLIGQDLVISRKEDIDRMKKTRSYKGIRHSLGLKVRGQRTKSTGRTSGRAVGVSKSRALRKAARKAAKEEQEAEE